MQKGSSEPLTLDVISQIWIAVGERSGGREGAGINITSEPKANWIITVVSSMPYSTQIKSLDFVSYLDA